MKPVARSSRIATTALFILSTLLPPIAQAETMARAVQKSGSRGGAHRSHGQSAKPAPKPSTQGGASGAGSKPSTAQQPAHGSTKPAQPSQGDVNGKPGQQGPGNQPGGNDGANRGNHQGNTNVNINNSKDITINNNHNTVVVANPRPYPRPPYAYGGHRYYCYHPYRYHPYHPYAWGPYYHPWGFVVATMAATAIVISVSSQQYHYDQGTYYVASNGSYVVVAAPVGATVTTLPPEAKQVTSEDASGYWYYGGAYYEKTKDGYKVVAPKAGTVVEGLPEGGKEVKIGDQTYVQVGETYYQPIQKDGKNMYEVVQVEAEKK